MTCRPQGAIKPLTVSTVKRFWSKVEVRGLEECWDWIAGKQSAGYGVLKVQGVAVTAHRLSYYIHNGVWPETCCHHCDNRTCVNPRHIYSGTQADNVRDCVNRGRTGARRKLSASDVRFIRASSDTGASLARKFRVGETAIYNVKKGNTYKEVPS